MEQRLKIGLALGSGLARGLAHIGVLKVFEEEGLKIDYIAGSSMGAVIAALYACGVKISLMERLAQRITRRDWMDFNFPRMGLIAGDRLEELIYLLSGRRRIEELPLPLAVVGADLLEGKLLVFREGSIARTVRASCSIPGVFNPVEVEGRLVVDGGVLERVPVKAVREMGADIAIGVDVSAITGKYGINHIFDVLLKTIDIMSREVHRFKIQEANLVITPDMQEIAPFHFHLAREAIEKGEEAARKSIPVLKQLMAAKEG